MERKEKAPRERENKNRKTQTEGKKKTGQDRSGAKRVSSGQAALCPVYKKCGGCHLLELPYPVQLQQKQRQVEKLLKPYCRTEKILGMEDPFHYRNKVHAVFGHRKDGTIISGTYQEKTHFIVPVEECLIEDPKADAIIRDIRGLLKSFRIKTYNEDTGFSAMRWCGPAITAAR